MNKTEIKRIAPRITAQLDESSEILRREYLSQLAQTRRILKSGTPEQIDLKKARVSLQVAT